jgi:hypothetical protein
VTTYLVNPAFSSVGGYTKYGRLNRCNADEAAAHWLARQALFGCVWKTQGNTKFVKKQIERLVFAHLPVTRTQSTKALADVQWKNVARALVRNASYGVKTSKTGSSSESNPLPCLTKTDH